MTDPYANAPRRYVLVKLLIALIAAYIVAVEVLT